MRTYCKRCAKFDMCYIEEDEPCIGYEEKKKTNYDLVVQMNPKELAEFLVRGKPFAKFCDLDCDDHKPCWSCALDWLNKEVEG